MKKRIKICCLFLMAATLDTAFAQVQHFCGTDEAEKLVFQQHPELLQQSIARDADYMLIDKNAALTNYATARTQSAVLIVPVVFHIIHQNGVENISDAKVREAIDVMNQDFSNSNPDTANTTPLFKTVAADCEIQFRLAEIDPNGNCTNGIERFYSWETNNGGESAKFNQWPQNKYLNIWVIKKMSAAHATAAAYSYRPGNAPTGGDGIISRYEYVGINQGNSHTLSHEAGHWINLYHTWGSGNQPGTVCGNDFVSDTPTTKGATSCNLNLSDCFPPIIENVQNHMDYSFCTTMFTLGQKTRMRTALQASTAGRNNLWTATNLAATGTGGASVFCAADFISNNVDNVVCEGGLVKLSDISYNGQIISRNWNCPGAVLSGTSTFADSSLTVQYNTAGVYAVSLSASNGIDTLSITKQQFITVVPSVAAYSSMFTESFEGAPIPNSDWDVANPDLDATEWIQSLGAGFSGNASVFLENFSSDSGYVDEFISPTFNASSIPNLNFSFRVAFAKKAATDADVLRIFTSIDCGKTWSPRPSINATTLAGSNPNQLTYFTPTVSTQWQKITGTIANVLSQSNVKIKFQFTGGKGNNIYIDDINIINPLGLNENASNKFQVSLYPNPTNRESALTFNLATSSKVSIKVLSVLGEEVETIYSGDLNSGNHKYILGKGKTLSSGIYFLNIAVNGEQIFKKLIVE